MLMEAAFWKETRTNPGLASCANMYQPCNASLAKQESWAYWPFHIFPYQGTAWVVQGQGHLWNMQVQEEQKARLCHTPHTCHSWKGNERYTTAYQVLPLAVPLLQALKGLPRATGIKCMVQHVCNKSTKVVFLCVFFSSGQATSFWRSSETWSRQIPHMPCFCLFTHLCEADDTQFVWIPMDEIQFLHII